ncbi:MAG: diaminopimelate epimerase [Alphaproteobacteria bacterium]|nr:diaminopimelate epimerase [Alphaproteobacteria bacterium]
MSSLDTIPLEGLPFTKMSGSGNDFIFIDNRGGRIPEAAMPALVRALCARRTSVGADGLAFIEPSDVADFRWRFFNSDGSAPGMCGNGARCVVRFARELGVTAPRVRFESAVGIIDGTTEGERVSVRLTPPHGFQADLRLPLPSGEVRIDHLDTGVPHAVLFVRDVDDIDLMEVAPPIRYHERLAPEGANVNLCAVTGPRSLRVRSYERGVEAETLACGTGVAACAVLAATRGLVEPPVDVTVRSGEVLTVHFAGRGDAARDVYLEGDVRIVFRGTLTDPYRTNTTSAGSQR